MSPVASPRVPAPAAASHSDVERSRRGGAHVVVRDLRKHFTLGGRAIPVLQGLTFELGPGEIASVVGASGVGKSTLLQVLGTLDEPTSGSIAFDGTDVTQMSPARLAAFRNREIGFVFQFHHLLPEFTALENAMMPGLIMRLPRAECVDRAQAMLGRLGLGDRLAHRPGELSGGEQQRVALARALLLSPRLLLADEPTGNLDTKTGREMHQLFFELNRELGMTILIVTHNNELAAQTPRKLRMADGRITDEA
ncbi:MAG TPA: ABC transporter ATP-binding protein [Polyangia bacterium]|nr:ABC transporter ATP-binding protein [Polyangia bacterium]